MILFVAAFLSSAKLPDEQRSSMPGRRSTILENVCLTNGQPFTGTFDATVNGQDVTFSAIDSGRALKVTARGSVIANVVLPGKYTHETSGFDCKDIPVTTLSGAWSGAGVSRSVVLGEGFTTIESQTFYLDDGQIGLKSIKLPRTLTSIGSKAFRGVQVEEFVFPPLVSELTMGTFDHCAQLRTIRLLGDIKSCQDWVFWGCPALANVYYCGKFVTQKQGNVPDSWGSETPSSVTVTVTKAYGSGTWLGKNVVKANAESGTVSGIDYVQNGGVLTLSSDVANKVIERGDVDVIGGEICAQCLYEVVIKDKITTIGVEAFRERSTLTVLTIRASLTEIRDMAFYKCPSLSKINIPDTVTNIGERVFSRNAITEICLPAKVTSIENGLFEFCKNLVEVNISAKSLSTLGQYAFHECVSLQKIFFCGSANPGADPTHGAFTADPDHAAAPESLRIYVPSGYTGDAFAERNGIVIKLGDEIFFDIINDGGLCYSFNGHKLNITGTGQVIEGNVVKAVTGRQLCATCSGIEYIFEVVLDTRITNIGQDAFRGCTNLASINVPEGLVTIGIDAFNGCRSLGISLSLPDTVTWIGAGCFAHCALLSVRLPSGLNIISDDAFQGCTQLTTVNMPGQLVSIGSDAFNGCVSLEMRLDLPAKVTQIGTGCFAHCALPSVHFPSGLRSVSSGAFEGCAQLAAFNMPAAMVTIGDSAFRGCKSLIGDFTVPESLTEFGDLCLSQCGLWSIVFTANVRVGVKAFAECLSLTYVKIEGFESTNGINGLFYGCSKLKEIRYCSEDSVGKDPSSIVGPFDGCTEDLKILVPFGYSGTFAEHAVDRSLDAECNVRSQHFTESSSFTSTMEFTETSHFIATEGFTQSSRFVPSAEFGETERFSSSCHFTESESFTLGTTNTQMESDSATFSIFATTGQKKASSASFETTFVTRSETGHTSHFIELESFTLRTMSLLMESSSPTCVTAATTEIAHISPTFWRSSIVVSQTTASNCVAESGESPDDSGEGNHGANVGLILGIVFGLLALIAVVVVLVWFLVIRRRNGSRRSGASGGNEFMTETAIDQDTTQDDSGTTAPFDTEQLVTVSNSLFTTNEDSDAPFIESFEEQGIF